MDPSVFADFMRRVHPRLVLPRTSVRVLRCFSGAPGGKGGDVSLHGLVEALRDNPRLESQILRDASQDMSHGETPSLRSAVLLLGMPQTRDRVLEIQLMGGLGPLRFAREAEKEVWEVRPAQVPSHSLTYGQDAYLAGLVWDALAASALSEGRTGWIEEALVPAWTRALAAARNAWGEVRRASQVAPTTGIFSAVLLLGIGEAVLSFLRPEDFAEFDRACRKAELPGPLRRFAETRRFGLQASELGALTCLVFEPLRGKEQSLLYPDRGIKPLS